MSFKSSLIASIFDGPIDLIGEDDRRFDADEGARVLAARSPHPDLQFNPDLPDDTRLWAALQNIQRQHRAGRVYDVDQIVERLGAVHSPLAHRSEQ